MSVNAAGDGSAAVGHNSGIVSTGSGAINTIMDFGTLPAPAKVDGPATLTHLPSRRDAFVGRAAEMARLTDRSASVGTRVQVLTGPAGAGKTALAEQFARTHAGSFRLVWWIDDASRANVEAALADLAKRLEPKIAAAPRDVAVSWSRSWLMSHGDWLIIADDAPGPGAVEPLRGLSPRGRVVVTSRGSIGWDQIAEPIALGELPGEAAVELMTAMLGDDESGSPEDLADLCAQLGNQPPAIRAAATHMRSTGTTPEDYLASLKQLPSWMEPARRQQAAELMTAVRSGGRSDDLLSRVMATETGRRLFAPALLSVPWPYARMLVTAGGMAPEQVAGWKKLWDTLAEAKAERERASRDRLATVLESYRSAPAAPLRRRRNVLGWLVNCLAFVATAAAVGAAVAERRTVHDVGLGNWIALVVTVCVLAALMRYIWDTALWASNGVAVFLVIVAGFLVGWLATPRVQTVRIGSTHLDVAHLGSILWAWMMWRF